jgi:membrane protein
LPAAVGDLLENELRAIVAADVPRLLSLSALGTLWVATYGTSTLITAMDRIYDVRESRRGVKRLAVVVGLTLLAGWALVGAFLVVNVLLAVGQQVLDAAGASETVLAASAALVWPITALLVLVAAVGVYRLAPNLALPPRQVLPGAAVFTLGWLVGTFGFSVYLTRFATYSVTYGALAGAVALLVWLYLTSYLLLAGAVLNAALRPPRVRAPGPIATAVERR